MIRLTRTLRPRFAPLRALSTSAPRPAATSPYSKEQRFTATNDTLHTSPVRAPRATLALLSRLHARSEGAGAELSGVDTERGGDDGSTDRIVAMDEDKCQFLYALVRAARARRVVVAGAGFGVGAVYCALGASQNARELGGDARVVATEYERGMAREAREVWKEAGVQVEMLEGDLRETLKGALDTVDFVLLDGESSTRRSVALALRWVALLHRPARSSRSLPLACPRR